MHGSVHVLEVGFGQFFIFSARHQLDTWTLTPQLLLPQSPRGFSALASLYYLARPTKTAMLRRLSSQGRIEEFLFRGGPTCAYEANNFQVLSLQTLGTKLVTNLFCYVHPQRHDTNGTHHILLVTTSSLVRFSLAFKVGREKARLTSKQGKIALGTRLYS